MTITTPMQTEAVFNQGGSYGVIVKNDILLHREAAEKMLGVVQGWLKRQSGNSPIRILDLACGGAPVITGNVMARLAPQKFDYLGIDINSDQIAKARQFPFSNNVQARLAVGNSWDLSSLQGSPFDIVFEGLNTHHATPEELQFFAGQLSHKIRPGGLFINYDLFRPAHYPYLHRPACKGKENLRLIPVDVLHHANIAEATYPAAPDWRDHHFLPLYIQVMKQKGVSQDLIDQTVAHIRERDYPVTTKDLSNLLASAGFAPQVYDFQHSKEPLKDYLDLVAAQKL